LLVVLFGHEILFLALKEDHRENVFENRIPRRIFGPKSNGRIVGWRKLHNELLHKL
jgi:hypothetical protein